MAAKTYKVTDSVLGEEVDFGDGKMNKFVLSLEDSDGRAVEGVALWRPVGSDGFLAGDTIEGEVKTQPRGGLKLVGGRKVDGSGGGSSQPPASGGSGGGYVWLGPFPENENERQVSIERQVALKAASEQAAALLAAGKDVSAAQVVERAGVFADFLRGSKPAGSKDADEVPF